MLIDSSGGRRGSWHDVRLVIIQLTLLVSLTASVCERSAQQPPPSMADNNCCDLLTVVTRDEWGARAPKNPPTNISVPVNMTFVHHSAGSWRGTNLSECVRQVRSIQDFHMDVRGWDDIGYSFLICEDGRVYDGRGWTAQGAHTLGYNAVSLGICIIGNYTSRLPRPEALSTAHNLLQCGVQKHYISNGYELFGHRDGRVGTECPGDDLYALIRTWPHFSTRPIHKYGGGGGTSSISSNLQTDPDSSHHRQHQQQQHGTDINSVVQTL